MRGLLAVLAGCLLGGLCMALVSREGYPPRADMRVSSRMLMVQKSDRLQPANSVIAKFYRPFPKYALAMRNSYGAFVVKGMIGALEVVFVVDTGSDLVCLTQEDAANVPSLKQVGNMRFSMASGVVSVGTKVVLRYK